MDYKKTGAEKSTITRDVIDIAEKTGNIYHSLSVISKRSKQINRELKDELVGKLEEFATNNEQLEEVFENTEQIAVSKYYEQLPKSHSIAFKELMEDEIFIKCRDVESSDSENKDA
jgi:DNA-directed RNA polymerase subunit K/omega